MKMGKTRLAVVMIMTISWALTFTACDDGTKLSPPSVPTGVSAVATSSSSITVSWAAVSNADGYHVYRSSSASGTYTLVGTPSTTSYTDTDLSESTTYYYKVSANNSAGESSQSSVVSATSIPSIPTGVNATATSSSSITVSWTAVSGATGYYVYRSSSASGNYTRVGTSSTASYTNTELSASTTYYYKVTAYNSGGESSQFSVVSATTMLSTPTEVNAMGTSTSSITVSWDTVSSADGYYVYRSSSDSGTYTRVGTLSTTTYIDTGLSHSTTYYYKVTAFNSDGESSQSSVVSAETYASVSGTYSYYESTGVIWYRSTYTFNSNGTYVYTITSNIDWNVNESGTYNISGSTVTLSRGGTLTIIDSRTIRTNSGTTYYKSS